MTGAYYFFHDQRREFLPLRDGFTLGRTRGHITFSDDIRISREHCRIHMIGDEVYIEDLGSTNRTTVNREEIDSHRRKRLRINDVVRIGGQRLVLTRQADAEPEIEDRTRTSRVIPVTRARAEAPRAMIEGQVLLADTQPVPARRQRPRADWRREPPRAVRATSEAGAPGRLFGSSWLLIWIAMATAVAKLLGMVP